MRTRLRLLPFRGGVKFCLQHVNGGPVASFFVICSLAATFPPHGFPSKAEHHYSHDCRDVCIDPLHSRKEALKAVSTLQNMSGTWMTLIFVSLEGILASFGWQTHLEEARSLKDTEITMYFTSN